MGYYLGMVISTREKMQHLFKGRAAQINSWNEVALCVPVTMPREGCDWKTKVSVSRSHQTPSSSRSY